MKARNGAARDGDEERRDDRHGVRVELCVGQRRQFGDPVGAEEQHAQQCERHEDEGHAEDRINLADDLVDGQQRGDEVVGQNQPDPHRVRHRRHHAAEDVGGTEQEDRTDEYEQHDREEAHELPHSGAQVTSCHFGDAQAVVAHEHDARQEVVHRTHEDAAQRDPQKSHGTERCSQNRAEDRTRTGDVEQLDQKDPPARHGHVVYAVEERFARYAAGRIDRCDPFQIAAVGEIGDDERREADEES